MRFETHAHTHYSNIRLIDSINKPIDLILTAYSMGYSGITITDHEALCGHVEWLQLEQDLKQQGLISKDFVCGLGNEIYLVDKRTPQESQTYYHFILIAKNTLGHRALRELSSQSWLNSYRYRGMERVPTLKKELVDIIKKYPNSLIATNACIGGQLGQLVLKLVDLEEKNKKEEAYQIKEKIDSFIKFCLGLFGDDFYLEIAPGQSLDQRKFNKRIKPIAEFYGLKMIVATDAHYLTEKDREIHKSFLNSKDGEREIDSFYHDAHLMTDEQAYDKIKDFYSEDEFNQMCENSLEIMGKIKHYEIFHSPIIPEVSVSGGTPQLLSELNDYPVLQELRNSNNLQEREWVICCLKSLQDKKLTSKEYYERLELEADIIKDIGKKLNNCLFSYFNTFKHYIDLFWDCGSVVGPGRGSAGSFLSNYLLGITQIDPIEWNLPYFRFLNKERAELPDIDLDLAPSKRPYILKKIREERGELNVVQVATFGTESAKAAIACACRGYRSPEFPKGIDVDIALYLSSLVPVERGITWSISDCLYGDPSKDKKPIKELINQIDSYPGLKEIILGVEGLVCRRGQHASGVMLYNKTPYETTALMKSPNGDITTQFDLHRSEKLGDTKFDFLVTDICDKLSVALSLLQKDHYFDDCKTKREIYNKYLHPQNINLNDSRLWEALAQGSVQDVFQFNTEIGIQTAKAIQPKNPAEMTSANALLRLAAPEGEERPLDRYIRFKNDLSLWYKEMDDFGLTKEEQKILEPYYLRDYGVPASQEQLMLMVMDKNISSFTLSESNLCRKILAKKMIKKIPELQEKFLSSCPSRKLGEYCWKTMMKPQMSYSFSEVHSLLYTFIGIQTLVIATNFPSLYWDTACLIVNSQSIMDDEEDELYQDVECAEEDNNNEEEDEEDNDEEKIQKKKAHNADYGRIATAIGKIKKKGVKVIPPDINKSGYTFSPDVTGNAIRFGLSGITRVGEELVQTIIAKRPYQSIKEFLVKVKVNKPQMVNLIKCGAFDSLGDRFKLMEDYIKTVSEPKKRITLQNMKALIDLKLLPSDYDFECKLFNYNKYLKKQKMDSFYGMDDISFNFYEKNFSLDLLTPLDTESGFGIRQVTWDSLYKKGMDPIRFYIKANQENLLNKMNEKLWKDLWNKYCQGNISQWEMDSVSCYFHEHELSKVDILERGFSNFYELPREPVIERFIPIKGKMIPILKLNRIIGTVLDRNKTKKMVTLLTIDGVVTVKIFGPVFAEYDKQISQKGADGKKHIIEKSLFSRGNKIIVTGVRRDDSFQAKKYSKTPYHLVEQITEVGENGEITIKRERAEAN